MGPISSSITAVLMDYSAAHYAGSVSLDPTKDSLVGTNLYFFEAARQVGSSHHVREYEIRGYSVGLVELTPIRSL